MAISPIRPRWQRIYHQSLTLTYKNLLIFYKAPISTLLRALIFPIAVTVVLCLLKNLDANSPNKNRGPSGAMASTATPIMDLGTALATAPSNKLVFVRNGMLILRGVTTV